MSQHLDLDFDSALLDSIAADFDLRDPNKRALRELVYTLNGDYDPEVMQVLALATGVGKTYLMAAFIEYLRQQGVRNVVIVTPGKTVQAKTVQNFVQGSGRYIEGSSVPPEVVTPQDYSAWVARQNGAGALSLGSNVPVLAFIFNIQQLIAPRNSEGDTHGSGADAQRRRPRRFDESAGVLFDYLTGLDDLVVIADESHLYSESATAFNAALRELDPAACVGLTATAAQEDHVIFHYPLYRAIQDEYVKQPVLAFRRKGYGVDAASEEQQLSDAMQLRAIKQRHYDTYAESQDRSRLNAVMFVVCADTLHADQVTALLRTPRYFGSELAVLQVDSNHEDTATQRLLDGLDEPNSPVLCVVSVNKLKEGWDVKNIAVVVTLRAMASEVLTQQTMGRGLRLPFGRYTHVLQIDQLDIIAHQSFKELLAAENVLVQFGLEDAVDEAGAAQVAWQVGAVTSGANNADVDTPANGFSNTGAGFRAESPSDAAAGASPEAAAPSAGGATVRVRDIEGSNGSFFDGQPSLSVERVARTPAFADVEYLFPRARVSLGAADIDLSKLEHADIVAAAKRVTSTGDVLVRKEIVAAVGGRLKTLDTESAEVESLGISDEETRVALLRRILGWGTIPATKGNKNLAEKYVVKTFMESAPVDHWTVKSLSSADVELSCLINNFVGNALRERHEETSIDPLPMPGVNEISLPLGETVHEQVESRSEFVRGRFYGNWFKSLFEAESFDSYTGEYLLARLLNTSPHIVWWQRLHMSSDAYIYYNSKDRYFPDFVALDTDGVHWIIEGKNEGGQANESVQAKRRAAEAVVHRLLGEDAYLDQRWGYLIAYERDIATSDSWDELKAKTHPVSNG